MPRTHNIIRVKFLANGPIQAGGDLGMEHHISVNPAPWMLKHYNDLHRRTPVQWLVPDFIADRPAATIVDDLMDEGVDVLLLAYFVWNQELQMSVAELFKSRKPGGTVIGGGPQLAAHKDPEFFRKYPFMDYVVYGDGERALTEILDYLGTDQRGDFVNTVENRTGEAKVWPFQVLRDELYWSTSPYLSQRQHIRDSLQALYDRGYTNKDVMLAVEFARGCMYRCAYCDWSQNLTKKVLRRKAEWKQELEFFRDLDVMMRETDANFGQWKEDIEIYDYATKLYDPDRNFKFLVYNTSKLKRNADHFMIGNAETYDHRFVLSLEDTDPEVLEAMGRPSLPWHEHQQLLARIRHRLGEQRFRAKATAEFMLGLPKQTVETFKENFTKVLCEGIRNIILNQWVYAVNSPGADPEYLRSHGIEFIEHRVIQHTSQAPATTPYGYPFTGDLAELYDIAETSPHFVKQLMVMRTSYMSMEDMGTVIKARQLILQTAVQNKLQRLITEDDWFDISGTTIDQIKHAHVRSVVDNVFAQARKIVAPIVEQHKQQIDKHGFAVISGHSDHITL